MKMLPIKMNLIKQTVDDTLKMNGYQLGCHYKIFIDAMKCEEFRIVNNISM